MALQVQYTSTLFLRDAGELGLRVLNCVSARRRVNCGVQH